MGFYLDFIKAVESTVNQQMAKSKLSMTTEHELLETWSFERIASHMRNAKIVRLSHDQAAIFFDIAPVANQDYVKWLRLPFKRIYIQLDNPITFKGYRGEYDHGAAEAWYTEGHKKLATTRGGDEDPLIRGIVLSELTGTEFFTLQEGVLRRPPNPDEPDPVFNCGTSGSFKTSEIERFIQISYLMPREPYLLNAHVATILVLKDGRLVQSDHGFWKTRAKMTDWAIHAINFLSSPSVKLAWNPPPEKLNQKRSRSGKVPLPGWYEITYRKTIHDYTPEKISKQLFHHSFRYDVRGHFKNFTRGPMTGRVIWCPPHQRGLQNTLYKPKTYRTENSPGQPTELYQG